MSTNFSPAEQGGGWMGGREGEGWIGRGSDFHTATFRAGEAEKPPKVATLSPYHTTRSRRHLANDRNSSRSWPAQLVPSVGAILLTVTS